jgi:hypothetical protein
MSVRSSFRSLASRLSSLDYTVEGFGSFLLRCLEDDICEHVDFRHNSALSNKEWNEIADDVKRHRESVGQIKVINEDDKAVHLASAINSIVGIIETSGLDDNEVTYFKVCMTESILIYSDRVDTYDRESILSLISLLS